MKLSCALLVSFGAVSQADILQLTQSPGMVLELNGRSSFPNSVDLQNQNNNENQVLTVVGNQIKVANRNLCLCASSFTNGALLQFNTCGACPNGGDQWNVPIPGMPSAITASSIGGMCIDVKDGITVNWQPVQLWACSGLPRQQWTRISNSPPPPPAPTPPPTPPALPLGQRMILQLTESPGMVLELNGLSSFPNSVDLQHQNNNENQLLTLSGNQIQVANRPNFCLCAPSFTDGALLQFNTCGACPNAGDQWNVGPPGFPAQISPTYAPGFCVDVKDGNTVNFQPIQLWTCFNNPQQKWTRMAGLVQSNVALDPVVV